MIDGRSIWRQVGGLVGKRGGLPLVIAASCGYTDIARLLLDDGALVDRCCDVGEATTPALYTAIHGKHLETVRLLLDRGASINSPDGGTIRLLAQ